MKKQVPAKLVQRKAVTSRAAELHSSLPRHGGNLRLAAQMAGKAENEILDFSANLNPLGPPEWLRQIISSQVSSLIHYPDPDSAALVQAIAERYGAKPQEIIVGNGTSELLYLLARVVGKKRALIPVPAYVDYAHACKVAGLKVDSFALREEDDLALNPGELAKRLRGDEVVFIGHPNNPTGMTCPAQKIRALAKKNPATLFVIDEAFGDFVEDFDSLTKQRPDNVVVLLSLTKSFAIPGLRVGCAIARAEWIQSWREQQSPWSVNTLAQTVGVAALKDISYLKETRRYVSHQRKFLINALSKMGGWEVYPGAANYLLVRVELPKINAHQVADHLQREGIIIRLCDNFDGLDQRYFRMAVRKEDENERFCAALFKISEKPILARVKKKTPAIMFQGTSSNAGKSILTAAFCRILLQDGYRVAPFKAQNMSLNSYVTRDGGEMGRAQVVQAQACRVEPDTRMNPILLKPNSNTGSQVIVLGKPIGNKEVAEYIRYKPEGFRTVCKAYDSLASEFDVMVLEGAGSPGEVNLKSHDIVNMSMARYAESPVLLVGDIDRGGIYASFVGTMEVLAEWERNLVAGFIVNRFRGKQSLLASAHKYVKRHTGKPVLGVVPYLTALGLPEEDGVTFKESILHTGSQGQCSGKCVEIALLDLPHISNFTDFDAFGLEEDVRVKIVRTPSDLGSPDVVIIPGSKNVIHDMNHLRTSGLLDAIARLRGSQKTEIVGICGGYQMLGEKISDPHHIESTGQTVAGLGWLPLKTTLAPEKTLAQVRATHCPTKYKLVGYEIHHGVSETPDDPLIIREDGTALGSASADGRVWGTYLHGIFDADDFRRWFINRLRQRRGWEPAQKAASYNIESALDRLAEVVRAGVDVKKIYRLMGLK